MTTQGPAGLREIAYLYSQSFPKLAGELSAAAAAWEADRAALEHQMPHGVLVEFWLDDKPYAARTDKTGHVPAIGDEVRFKGVAYKIIYRIWIYDETRERVALNMERLEPAPAKE